MNVTIRAYEAADAESLWQAVRESVPEVFPWLPWAHAGYSMADAMDWAHSRAQLLAERREFTFAIVAPDGRFLGGCGVNQINPITDSATSAIGSALRRPAEEWREPPCVSWPTSHFGTPSSCGWRSCAPWATSEVSVWRSARERCERVCYEIVCYCTARPWMRSCTA